MYCDKCGKQVSESDSFCPACGHKLKPAAAASGGSCCPPRPVASHVKILAVLWIVWAVLHVFPMGGMLFTGTWLARHGDWLGFHHMDFPGFIAAPFMMAFAGLALLGALAGIIGGIGLLSYASWARVILIILGIISLLSFPFGTLLGAYTLWVLLPERNRLEFERLAGRGDRR